MARMDLRSAAVTCPAPTFGDSTQWVLETLLRYDDDRIADLVIAGALD